MLKGGLDRTTSNCLLANAPRRISGPPIRSSAVAVVRREVEQRHPKRASVHRLTEQRFRAALRRRHKQFARSTRRVVNRVRCLGGSRTSTMDLTTEDGVKWPPCRPRSRLTLFSSASNTEAEPTLSRSISPKSLIASQIARRRDLGRRRQTAERRAPPRRHIAQHPFHCAPRMLFRDRTPKLLDW